MYFYKTGKSQAKENQTIFPKNLKDDWNLPTLWLAGSFCRAMKAELTQEPSNSRILSSGHG